MTGYSANWSAIILTAIIFHLAAALGFSFVVQNFSPAPKVENVAALDWVDIDLSNDVTIVDTQEVPTETVTETLSTFNAQDLFVPVFKTPELPAVEKIPPQPSPPELKPVERPQLPLPEQKISERPQPPAPEQKVSDEKISETEGGKLMASPPVTLTEFYPKKGGGLGYTGVVLISATIGADGKVKAVELVQGSGRYFVDEIALDAARRWTFRPALDKFNRPMACVKIIGIDFKKFS